MTPETIDYNKLATAIVERLTPRLPADQKLWDVATIAEYTQMSASQVAQRIVCHPDFPPSIRVPVANGRSEKSRAHPRWKGAEVIAWIEKHREKN